MKTYVLWTSKGPVATGDLDALKVRAERLVMKIVGPTKFLWELLDKVEDDDPDNRLVMTRKSLWDNWIKMPYFIDEVPVLVSKKKKEAGK